jgi:hypothetical protein
MPWSGGSFTRTNGVNTGATLWAQDRDDGTKILATRHDTNDQDMADGINSTLEKSGSNAATGNLNIGSNRLTAVADGTAKTDAATVNQIQSNGPAFQATDTGTANTYVIALSPAITAYAAGQEITFKAGAASTGASTLNVNTLGTKALKKLHDQDIESGDIEAGSIVTAVYDGTNFQVTSQLASSATSTPGGSNTQVQYNSSGSFAGDADFTFDGTNVTVANPLYLPDGSSTAPALSNTGDTNTGIAFPAADTVGVVAGGTEQFRFGSNPIPGGNKNLIRNGNFSVHQRGTSIAAANGTYTLDGWKTWLITGGACTMVFDDGSGGAGKVFGAFGASQCLRIDVDTAESSVAASDRFVVAQPIEAQNLQHLKYGTAAAEAVTVSFGFRSPKSGTHYVALYQADANRYCWRSFTVDSANTAQLISVTFVGDTSGTINNDTGVGLFLYFPLMAGSNFEGGSDNTWAADEKYGAATIQNLLDSTSNTIYIGRVQMEVGSVATDFEFEDVGVTLNRCLRYFEYQPYVVNTFAAIGFSNTTTSHQCALQFTEKRLSAPTIAVSTAGQWEVNRQGTDQTCTSLSGSSASRVGMTFIGIVSSGLTAGEAAAIRSNNSGNYVSISSEL